MNETNVKRIFYFILLFSLVVTLVLALPSPVSAQSDDDNDKVVLGGRYRLRSGETLDGNLIVIGGTAIIEDDARVKGNILITGGTLEVSGTIDGNITAFGGSIELLDDAVVNGNLMLSSADLSQSPDAVVNGDIQDNVININSLNLNNIPSIVIPQTEFTRPYNSWVNFLTKSLWEILRWLAMSALAALIVLIAQKPTERVARSISAQPIIASGFGLLTVLVAPALIVLLTITIILIPIALIGVMIMAVAGLFGWVAVGYETGKRLERALKQNWAPAITAGLGSLALAVVMWLFSIIPCVGWVIPTLISILGIGGVLISRFGTQVYGIEESNPYHNNKVIEGVVKESPAEQAAPSPQERGK